MQQCHVTSQVYHMTKPILSCDFILFCYSDASWETSDQFSDLHNPEVYCNQPICTSIYGRKIREMYVHVLLMYTCTHVYISNTCTHVSCMLYTCAIELLEHIGLNYRGCPFLKAMHVLVLHIHVALLSGVPP